MNCNFTWYTLPNQIKKLIKPFENQLSKEAKNITWYNLPYKLNKIYKELVLLKTSCDLNPKFIWFALNKKAEAICELIKCLSIIANPDFYTSPTVVGVTIVGNVLLNDTLNGVLVNNNVFINNSGASGRGFPSIQLNGDITIDPQVLQGIYTISYNICEIANPTNCSSFTSGTLIVT